MKNQENQFVVVRYENVVGKDRSIKFISPVFFSTEDVVQQWKYQLANFLNEDKKYTVTAIELSEYATKFDFTDVAEKKSYTVIIKNFYIC